MKLSDLLSEMSAVEISTAERTIKHQFRSIGIDIKFTKHFKDRIADGAKDDHGKRDNITFEELMNVFNRLKSSHDELFKEAIEFTDEIKLGKFEGVIQEALKSINIPFILNFIKSSQTFELICKTIMKRKNFHTKNTDHVIKL